MEALIITTILNIFKNMKPEKYEKAKTIVKEFSDMVSAWVDAAADEMVTEEEFEDKVKKEFREFIESIKNW